MKHLLVISSFVAGSNVGGSLAMKLGPQIGFEVSLLPTSLLGRHPGWGVPGGGPVSGELFSGMADGLSANDIPAKCDGVLTGYFTSVDQVKLTASIIKQHLKGRVPVIVDPIMGDDDKGLYVSDEVAAAIVSELVPLADVLTPNAWEFEEILLRRAGIVQNDDDIERLAEPDADLSADVFITSFRYQGEIGILGPDNQFAGANELDSVPNGVGDLAALLIARNVLSYGNTPVDLADIVAAISRQIEITNTPELSALLSSYPV